jgi:TMEM175 potassium channel family protein
MAAVAYYILTMTIIAAHGKDYKGKISVVLYAVAVPLELLNSFVALGIYAAVAVMWLIPDSRIEKAMHGKGPVSME